MTLFPHRNIEGFLGNNQTMIKYENFICYPICDSIIYWILVHVPAHNTSALG